MILTSVAQSRNISKLKDIKIRCDHVLSKSSWIFKNVFKVVGRFTHFEKGVEEQMLNCNNKMAYIILLQKVM